MAVVDFDAAQLETLKGQLDVDHKTLRILDRKVAALYAKESDSSPWTGAGGAGALDFASQTGGSPGFVTDQALAREGPCLCYEIQRRAGGAGELCFKHGIVGALDEGQIGLYCEVKDVRQPTPEQKARLTDFQESADICKVKVQDLTKGERMEPYLSCMEKELRARNRALSGAQVVPDESTPMVSTPSAVSAVAGQGAPPADPSQTSGDPFPLEPAPGPAGSDGDGGEDTAVPPDLVQEIENSGFADSDEDGQPDGDQADDLGNGDTD